MTDLVLGLATWITHNSISVLIASLAIFAIISLIYLVVVARLRSIVASYQRLLITIGDQGVEQMLLDQEETVRSTRATVDSFQERLLSLEQGQQAHLQRVGVVRFNAFADTGSDLSFSVAIMDRHDNGVVISCIHGRDEARTYAKPLVQGRSSYPLSREELSAIERAAKSSSLDAHEGKRLLKSE